MGCRSVGAGGVRVAGSVGGCGEGAAGGKGDRGGEGLLGRGGDAAGGGADLGGNEWARVQFSHTEIQDCGRVVTTSECNKCQNARCY